jgi:hypothetical protein
LIYVVLQQELPRKLLFFLELQLLRNLLVFLDLACYGGVFCGVRFFDLG